MEKHSTINSRNTDTGNTWKNGEKILNLYEKNTETKK
jgi:hypothetical protein